MASEPLNHTSNCKQEAKVGAFCTEKVFPSQRAVFRCWSRKQDGQLGAAKWQSCGPQPMRRDTFRCRQCFFLSNLASFREAGTVDGLST